MEVKLGFIGGSGLYEIPGAKLVKKMLVKTSYGKPSDPISVIELAGVKTFFLSRHGKGHRLAPSEINYCANIAALKKVGVTHIISVSAVGSLKEEIVPSDLVLPDQYFDMTKGIRRATFYNEGMVGHTSMGHPVCAVLKNYLKNILIQNKFKHHVDGTYVCIEGPRFSTKAESLFYRSLGASVIGMTNIPEAFLARELGMSYATLALATDYDCWKEGEEVDVSTVLKTIHENITKAQKVVEDAIKNISKLKLNTLVQNSFQYAIQTKKEALTPSAKKRLKELGLR